MILLSADTSGPRCVLAVSDAGRLLAGLVLNLGRTHGQTFFRGMQQLLDLSGLTVQDVEAIGCGVGPGSFTGLRIAVTACKVLAFQNQIPVYPLSSLAALAEPFWGHEEYTVPAWDARNHRVFTACYDPSGMEYLHARAEDRTVWLKHLEEALPAHAPVCLLGAFADSETWTDEEREVLRRNSSWNLGSGGEIEPAQLARLTWRAVEADPTGGDPMQLNPAYLVPSQAERMVQQRSQFPRIQQV